jgi:hypothetical protein
MITTPKPVVVKYGGPSKNISLPAYIARAERYMEKNREAWVGSQEEFNVWSRDYMAGLLRNLAFNLIIEEKS